MSESVHSKFRTLMGRFVTSVTVIAVADESVPSGVAAMTASSVTSVSLTPLLLLFCVRNESSMLERLRRTPSFSVNVLASHQDTISRFYAGQRHMGVEGDWNFTDLNTPVLDGANASFVCRTASLQEVGDHHVVVGEVVEMLSLDPPEPALIYAAGQYMGVALS